MRRLILACAVLVVAALPARAQTFVARLSGSQEVPVSTSSATGTATAVLSGSTLTFSGSFTGVSSGAVASHIHTAPQGTNGAVLFNLVRTTGTGTADSWAAAANTFTLTTV